MALELYNSLTQKKEPFTPLTDTVGIYTCGPTVYDYVTIGNWRTYTLGDLLVRTLTYSGYNTAYYMNITDVGHLTGDNTGDADTGEDRMEKATKREGKTAWDIASFYADDFKKGYTSLNLTKPKEFLQATEHVDEQIALIQKLEEKGLTYNINDGIYFNTKAYEALGYTYGELSNLDTIQEGARVAKNEQKKDPRDFALWKFGSKERQMLWESPWGEGFPGWHIECSAMSLKCLGDQFDIHIGGEDLKSTHHPNEIAQSQGATGVSPFVSYWLHGAFLQVDGGRMGKSLGNAYTLHDLEEKGFSPLDLRYFYLTAHYRNPLNFTWEALTSAKNARIHLQNIFTELPEGGSVNEAYNAKFKECIQNDLDMPGALAIVWDLTKDTSVSKEDIKATLISFDTVLGLKLDQKITIPEEITLLAEKRIEARNSKDWETSDTLRDEITALGYSVKDTEGGYTISKIQ